MGGYLDTKRLMRQCQAIGRKQAAEADAKGETNMSGFMEQLGAIVPSTETQEPLTEETTVVEPTKRDAVAEVQEFEKYLTEFLHIMRDSNKRYDAAVLAEMYPNQATQDIMHAIEFAPSQIDFESLIPVLHELRTERRSAKKELEVTRLIKEWYNKHEKAFNELQNVLGEVRKVLKRQPRDMYCFKTDVVGPKDSWMTADPLEDDENAE